MLLPCDLYYLLTQEQNTRTNSLKSVTIKIQYTFLTFSEATCPVTLPTSAWLGHGNGDYF
jgi:hypothetical protein